MVATYADDVRGQINPDSVAIPGVGTVINERGEWVGSNVGLRGPEGPIGPERPQGPPRPAGDVVMVEGEQGFEDLATVVLDQLSQPRRPTDFATQCE